MGVVLDQGRIEVEEAGASEVMSSTARARAQRLFPITDGRGGLLGVATRSDIEAAAARAAPLASIARPPVVARVDEPVRAAIHRMAEMGITRLPVLDRSDPPALVGMITLKEALKARARHLEEGRRRERVLPVSAIIPLARWLRVKDAILPARRSGE